MNYRQIIAFRQMGHTRVRRLEDGAKVQITDCSYSKSPCGLVIVSFGASNALIFLYRISLSQTNLSLILTSDIPSACLED